MAPTAARRRANNPRPPFPTDLIQAFVDFRRGPRLITARVSTVISVTDSWETLVSKLRDLARPHSDSFAVDWTNPSIKLKTSCNTSLGACPDLKPDLFIEQFKESWQAKHRNSSNHSEAERMVLIVWGSAPETAPLRSTAQRITEAAQQITSHREENGLNPLGPLQMAFMSQANARVSISQRILDPPQNNPVFQAASAMDEARTRVRQREVDNDEVEITIKIRRSDLRAILGLPDYPLMRMFARPMEVNVPAPADPDMLDMEHSTPEDVVNHVRGQENH